MPFATALSLTATNPPTFLFFPARVHTQAAELGTLVDELAVAGRGDDAASAERAAAERAAHAKAELLAGSLSARRCYSSASAGPLLDYITFDPRLLLFEFAHDLLLREA